MSAARLAPALTITLALALLMGCIVLPIPVAEKTVLQGQRLPASRLDAIEPGKTTREEVGERLGRPTFVWPAMRAYVYDWSMRQGLLLWALGGGMQAAFGAMDIPAKYSVIVRFDAQDRVAAVIPRKCPVSEDRADCLRDWMREVGAGGASSFTASGKVRRHVLMRVQCVIDGAPRSCGGAWSPLTSLWLANFDSYGDFRFLGNPRLMEAGRRSEWLTFDAPAGVNYLAMAGPEEGGGTANGIVAPSGEGRRWRLDLPDVPGVVYVGTLRLHGHVMEHGFWGDKIGLAATPPERLEETAMAREAAGRLMDEARLGFQTVLMRPWHVGEPFYIGHDLPDVEAW